MGQHWSSFNNGRTPADLITAKCAFCAGNRSFRLGPAMSQCFLSAVIRNQTLILFCFTTVNNNEFGFCAVR